ncbi:MAG: hypothetical protein VB031_02185 [Eubacteriaceae bacterium]|nr:hypothetical protein [Eubacteriaceae bacterium]
MNYSYDPTKITDGGADQMRFELGDTEVEGKKETTALSDEEYTAVITKVNDDGRGWTYAKYLCVRAIMMRYSNETDFNAGGASIALSQRYDRWKDLYEKLKKTFQRPEYDKTNQSKSEYVEFGMHDNPSIGAAGNPFNGVPNR